MLNPSNIAQLRICCKYCLRTRLARPPTRKVGYLERFTDSKYDNGRKDKFHPAWRQAIKAATKSGHSGILGVLLDRARLIDRERPSKEKIRDLYIAAARAEHLPCVELLVAKHNADPDHAKRRVKMHEEMGQYSAAHLKKDQNQHRSFYYSILNGGQ